MLAHVGCGDCFLLNAFANKRNSTANVHVIEFSQLPAFLILCNLLTVS